MIKAEIHFKDGTEPTELENIIEIKFKHGDSVWKYYSENGPTTAKFRVGMLDYVRLGKK